MILPTGPTFRRILLPFVLASCSLGSFAFGQESAPPGEPAPNAGAADGDEEATANGATTIIEEGVLDADHPTALHRVSAPSEEAGEEAMGGLVRFWVECDSGSAALEALDHQGQVLARETQGGGPGVPLLRTQFTSGTEYPLRVARTSEDATVIYRLHARFLPESPASIEAEAEILRRLGEAEVLFESGDLEQARILLRSTFDRFASIPGLRDSTRVHEALWKVGAFSYTLKDPELPIDIAERSVRFSKRNLPGLHASVVNGMLNLSSSLVSASRHGEAHPYLVELDGSLTRAYGDDQKELPFIRLQRYLCDRELGRPSIAQEGLLDLERSFEPKWRRERSLMLQIRVTRSLALYDLGDFESALRIQESALDEALTSSIVGPGFVTSIRDALGASFAALGDFEGAQIHFEEAVEGMRATHPEGHPRLANAVNNLAAARISTGHPEGAVEMLLDLLETVDAVPDFSPRIRRRIALNLCLAQLSAGELEHALDTHAELRPLDALDTAKAQWTLNHALLLIEGGRTDEAEEALRGWIETHGEGIGSAFPALRATYRLLALDVEVARGSQGGALKAVEHMVADLGSELTAGVLSGSVGEAEASAARAWGQLHGVLGGLLWLDESPRRRDLLERAFALDHFGRSAGIRARTLGRGALSRLDPERLRDLRSEWRAANDALAAAMPSDSAGGPDRAEVIAAIDRRDRAEVALRDAISIDSNKISIEGMDLRRGLGPRDVAVMFSRASNVGPSPEHRRLPSSLVAWVLRDHGPPRLVDLGSLERAREVIESWRLELTATSGTSIADASRAGDEGASTEDDVERGVPPRSPGVRPTAREGKTHGEAVAALIWEPLGIDSETCDRLVVLPHDVLFRIPFDAIPWPTEPPQVQGTTPVSRADRPRLGDAMDIQWAPALDSLIAEAVATPDRGASTPEAEPSSTGPERVPFLLVGDIEYGEGPELRRKHPFSPLPGTAIEIEDLGRLLGDPERPAVVLRGSEATREAFLDEAPRARRLHVGTHGWYDTVDRLGIRGDRRAHLMGQTLQAMAPLLTSGLAFAGANTLPRATGEGSGVVLADDLAELDLTRCELAVLSACESSLGPLVRGSGLRSMQTALHGAGVRTTITSLWPVSDQSTAEWMRVFYRAHLEEGLAPATALKIAKRTLRARHPDPHHWAGWVVSGFLPPIR